MSTPPSTEENNHPKPPQKAAIAGVPFAGEVKRKLPIPTSIDDYNHHMKTAE